MKRRRLLRAVEDSADSVLSPHLARRLHVVDADCADPFHPLHPPSVDSLVRRATMLGAGRRYRGALLAEQGAAFGLEVRDPPPIFVCFATAWLCPRSFLSTRRPAWTAC